MRTGSIAGMALFAAFFLVFAGVSQAGGMMDKSAGTGMPEQQMGSNTQNPGVVYDSENGPVAGYREALGAGALPGSGEISPSDLETWHTDLGSGSYGENGPPAGSGDVFAR